MNFAFLIIALVLFLVDAVLAFAAPSSTPWPAVLLYAGLASFTASFLPWTRWTGGPSA